MNYLKQYNLKYNGETDLAYEAYQKIVFECLPKLIKNALNNRNSTINFQLTFENVRNGLTGEIADLTLTTSDGKIKEKLADNMNIEEFESYYIPVTGEVHAQPAKKDDVIYVNNIFFAKGNIIDLINFYYEELQREEYETNRTR